MGTARVLGPDVGAAPLGALRLLVAAAGLLAFVGLAGPGLAAVRTGMRSGPAVLAGAGMALFQLTFLGAVVVAGVAVGTLVAIGSVPMFAAMFSRSVTRAWVGSTSLGLAGLVLLVLGGGRGSEPLTPAGVLLALGAGASYATYLVASRRLLAAGHAPDAAAAAAFAYAAVLLAPGLLLADPATLVDPGVLATATYLGLVPTMLAYLVLNRGLGGVSASTAGTLGLAEPVVATGLGVLVLGERLSLTSTAGAVLVLAALGWLAWSTGRPAGSGRSARPAADDRTRDWAA